MVAAAPPEPSADQKLRWILQLEDERVARGSEPGQDMVAMLADSQAHIRRRAALGLGRARLEEAVQPLSTMLATQLFVPTALVISFQSLPAKIPQSG